MTEQEYLVCDDPGRMLAFLCDTHPRSGQPTRMRPSDRRLRLWACACCRAVWDKLTDPRSRRAVEVAERYADGLATESERAAARKDAMLVIEHVFLNPNDIQAAPAFEAAGTCKEGACNAVTECLSRPRGIPPAAQADLLRHIVGNPWRLVSVEERQPCGFCFEHKPGWVHDLRLDEHGMMCAYGEKHCPKCKGRGWHSARSPWITPTVRSLAESLYSGEPCASMLHDALIEAGCPETVACYECEGTGMVKAPEGDFARRWSCDDCDGTGRLPHPLLAHFRPRVACGKCAGIGVLYHDDEWKCHACAGRGFTGGEYGEHHPKGCWAIDLILGKE